MKKLLLLTMAVACGLGCVCVSHGAGAPPPSYEEATQKACEACTFLNNSDARFCAICGTAFDQRPARRAPREEDVVRGMGRMSLAPGARERRAAPEEAINRDALEADLRNKLIRITKGEVPEEAMYLYEALFNEYFEKWVNVRGNQRMEDVYSGALYTIESWVDRQLGEGGAKLRSYRGRETFVRQAVAKSAVAEFIDLFMRNRADQLRRAPSARPAAMPAMASVGYRPPVSGMDDGSMSSGEYARRMDGMMGRDFLARGGKEFEQQCPAGCGSAIGQHDLEAGRCGICYERFAPRRQAAEQPARGRLPLAEEGSEEDFRRAPRHAGPARPAAAVASPAALQGLRMARATVQEKASPDGSWEGWLDVSEKGDRVRIKVTGSAIGRRGLGLNQFSNFYYIDTAGNILPKGLFYWQRAQKVAPKPQEGEARFERGVWVKYKFGAKQGDRGVEWDERKIQEEHPWKK